MIQQSDELAQEICTGFSPTGKFEVVQDVPLEVLEIKSLDPLGYGVETIQHFTD
jgi:hypothetical protein